MNQPPAGRKDYLYHDSTEVAAVAQADDNHDRDAILSRLLGSDWIEEAYGRVLPRFIEDPGLRPKTLGFELETHERIMKEPEFRERWLKVLSESLELLKAKNNCEF